jgi:hypothetical protein
MGTVASTPVPQDGSLCVDSSYGTYREKGRHVQIAIAMSSSYATGGDTLDLSAWFPTAVYRVNVWQYNPPTISTQPSKYLAAYVPGTLPNNGLVKIVDSTSGSQVTNVTDLHTFNYMVEGWGE